MPPKPWLVPRRNWACREIIRGIGIVAKQDKIWMRHWYFCVWLLLAAIILAVTVPLNVLGYLRLAFDGARTTATIIELDCDNHNSARYTLTIGSTRFERGDIMQTDCRAMHLGDRIQVYYYVSDPSFSRVMAPWPGLANEAIPIGLACLLFPPAIIGGFRRAIRNLRASN